MNTTTEGSSPAGTRVRDPAGDARLENAPVPIGAVRRATPAALVLLALSAVGWAALAWMAIDMGHPLVQLAMPMSSHWTATNLLAIWTMWAVMMAAMMLPSAMPMVLTFVRSCSRSGERLRSGAFVSAYLLIWSGFSVAATASQWLLQDMGLVNPMIVSTSAGLTAVLLLVAGVYQFSPLKRMCLSHCRSPVGFLLGEWRSGAYGGLVMGLRHGLFCLGCCWALMALLFVFGVMNVLWIAALAIFVLAEKVIPLGRLVARIAGVGFAAAGLWLLTLPGQ